MIPLLDTHVHFWNHDVKGMRWPWLEKGFKSPLHKWTEEASRRLEAMHDARRFTTPEFREEVTGAGVGGFVHAHAATEMEDPAFETRWLAEMAAEHGWPSAMIGSIDLADPDGPDLLRRHRKASPRCTSVRDMNGPKGLDLDACAATLDTAAELGFSVELRTAPEKFDMFAAFADRWPGVNFVLSHASLPLQRSPESLEQYREAAKRLAEHPNWYCKISALCGGSDPNWTIDSIRPWAETCYSIFGPDRATLGTNWPVDRLFGKYTDVIAAYRKIFEPLDEAAQRKLFHGNAAALYGVPVEELLIEG